jgi:hypothetical protein
VRRVTRSRSDGRKAARWRTTTYRVTGVSGAAGHDLVDLDERHPSGHSAWAHLYIVLSSGERRLLLDDRGWSTGAATIAQCGLRHIKGTATTAVGPDGPGPGETDEQMEGWYWDWMERKLNDLGTDTNVADVKVLPHDVEIGASAACSR